MNDTSDQPRCRTYSTDEVHVLTGIPVSTLCEAAANGVYDQTFRPFRSAKRSWRWPVAFVDEVCPPVTGEVA